MRFVAHWNRGPGGPAFFLCASFGKNPRTTRGVKIVDTILMFTAAKSRCIYQSAIGSSLMKYIRRYELVSSFTFRNENVKKQFQQQEACKLFS
jgi:hypothetical protein